MSTNTYQANYTQIKTTKTTTTASKKDPKTVIKVSEHRGSAFEEFFVDNSGKLVQMPLSATTPEIRKRTFVAFARWAMLNVASLLKCNNVVENLDTPDYVTSAVDFAQSKYRDKIVPRAKTTRVTELDARDSLTLTIKCNSKPVGRATRFKTATVSLRKTSKNTEGKQFLALNNLSSTSVASWVATVEKNPETPVAEFFQKNVGRILNVDNFFGGDYIMNAKDQADRIAAGIIIRLFAESASIGIIVKTNNEEECLDAFIKAMRGCGYDVTDEIVDRVHDIRQVCDAVITAPAEPDDDNANSRTQAQAQSEPSSRTRPRSRSTSSAQSSVAPTNRRR